ncbi:MAG: radical SAM protein, partial [Oscillospiraceae bacterium]|nr:radical SAM protein [Oscillospiraceae bacterium]
MNKLISMNLELTTACPFRCPQCYCNMDNVKHLDIEVAKKLLKEAASLGLKSLSISGGETMCYPHLIEIISFAKECGIPGIHAAFSGWNFNKTIVKQMIDAGLSSISISLNGSTEEINRITRQGYEYAINALSILREINYDHTSVNWVMHSNNVDDFDNLVALCEDYHVEMIDIISFKPDAHSQLNTVPSKEQLYKIANKVRTQNGNVIIGVENCFSPLLALTADTVLFGNLNRGKYRGCIAGYGSVSVNVDGSFSPCRHILYKEHFDSIEEYLSKSQIIKKLSECDESKAEEPCKSCKYILNCRPCMAINTE